MEVNSNAPGPVELEISDCHKDLHGWSLVFSGEGRGQTLELNFRGEIPSEFGTQGWVFLVLSLFICLLKISIHLSNCLHLGEGPTMLSARGRAREGSGPLPRSCHPEGGIDSLSKPRGRSGLELSQICSSAASSLEETCGLGEVSPRG